MRRVTDPAELVEALRSRCTMRLAELAPFRDPHTARDPSYRSRWAFTSHLLYHVEELPDDIASLGDLHEILEMSIEAAQEDVDASRARRTDSSSAILGSAVASEAEFCRMWLESPTVPTGGFPRVPYRHVLDHEAHARMWRLLGVKFPEVRGDAGQGGAAAPWGTDLGRLAELLAGQGVDRAYLVHPSSREQSFIADARLLAARAEDGAPHYFPPHVAFLTSRQCDFWVFLGDAGPSRADGWISRRLAGG